MLEEGFGLTFMPLHLQLIRFWGKVLGTMKNYYIAEVEFGEGDYESELDDDEELASELNNMVNTSVNSIIW